jgi:hypothetical protein
VACGMGVMDGQGFVKDVDRDHVLVAYEGG